MLLSIIILNYNTFQLTSECIRSIKETTTINYEILLIDNNSKERDPNDFLIEFPEIRLTVLKENLGFGRANNIGMKEAIGDYFLLLNSDTIILNGTIDKTFNYLIENKNIDVLGCKCVNEDGSDQLTVYSYGNELNLFSAIKFYLKKNSIIHFTERVFNFLVRKIRNNFSPKAINNKASSNNNKELIPNYNDGDRIGSILGVYLMIKKSVFQETKGFDPDFFMYYEESEWFIKRLRNYNLIYYPYSAIIHYGGKSDIYNKMNIQERLSEYLFWYKISYLHYYSFVFFNLINIPCNLLIGLVTFNKRLFKSSYITLKLLPYAFLNIPFHSNKFHSRPAMLKIKGLSN